MRDRAGGALSRWGVVLFGSLLAVGLLGVTLGRALGWSGSRLSVLVSVVAAWLAAYAVWGFAAGTAARLGWLARYDGEVSALLAVVGGVLHYRAHVAGGRERGLVVYVGGQLAWLLIVMARNGAFSY